MAAVRVMEAVRLQALLVVIYQVKAVQFNVKCAKNIVPNGMIIGALCSVQQNTTLFFYRQEHKQKDLLIFRIRHSSF